LVTTLIALNHVSTQSRRAAHLDSSQGAKLCAIELVAIAFQEDIAILTHHISHFERGAAHES
jgi:hypothetical protein